ncbi:hypothetical protein ACJRO7_018059 [Eucalyptus globulus]|uniref:PGG domain-containing protein n=1 Tax=Eucalyptus globulus TaxID=34317 RepID=A0ABD3KT76_EUCGL
MTEAIPSPASSLLTPHSLSVEKKKKLNEDQPAKSKKTPPHNLAENWFRFFQYDPEHDKPGHVRDILLIIATLMATITFQAGLNPPSGIWQDNDNGHSAGRAMYLIRLPFMCYWSPALSPSPLLYLSAIFAVTPHESVRFRYVLIVGSLPMICRCIFQSYGMLNKKEQAATK